MPNANENTAENTAPITQGDAATEPIDLAQAFKVLNQINREAAQEPVETREPEEHGADDIEEGSDSSEGEGSIVTEPESGDGTGDDGSSIGIDAIDFNAQKQELLRGAQQRALQQVRKEFASDNIGYYSAAELTVQDEQTGQIRFRNPDVQDERDPNYYFKSRAEMQQFIQAWNQGVDFEFRKAVNEKAREYVTELQPTARMIDFLPTWNAMDDATKAIFDDLLEGHEVRDANGKEIGFNVNLFAVAQQAERIAKRFNSNTTVVQQQQDNQAPKSKQQSSGPALDMPTGNGKSEDEKEPTNIGEALKMWDKKNKKGK